MASEVKEDGVKSGSPGLEESEVPNSSVQNCVLCGCSTPAVRCDKCNSQTFCLSCDDMYHRHPKRRLHLRKAVDSIWNSHRSPRLRKSTNLPGDPSKIPIPPPRRRRRERFNTFTGVSFPRTPFDISAIARRDSWTAKVHGVNKPNAVVPKSAVGGHPEERNAIEPSYENSSSFHEQNLQSDPSINGATHEPMEQIDIDKKQTPQSVSNGNIKKSCSTEMDQLSNIHMPDTMPIPVSPTAVVHDENQDGRTTGYPAQMYSRGSHMSHSAADLRSMPMSPHLFYPPPHPAIPHHIHPFSPSIAHMNCSQCVSASWSNLMSPHLPPYHLQPQWNSASSTLSRKRHASGMEGQIKPNQAPLDSSGYPVSHVPFATPAYPYVGSPFYPHGYPAAESPTSGSQTPGDMQRNAKCSSLSPRISQSSDRQEEFDQMLASAQSNEGEKERPEVEKKQVAVEEAEEVDLEGDDNVDEDEVVNVLPEKPNEPWSCIHCTYINPPGSHICEVCCKTSYVAPQKVTKKKKKQEYNSDILFESADIQDKDLTTSSSIVAADDMMQIDSEQHFSEDPEKLSIPNDVAEKEDEYVNFETESISEMCKDANILESDNVSDGDVLRSCEAETVDFVEMDVIKDISEIRTVDHLLTTETQTITSTTSTNVQTQQLSCVSVASSTDSLLHLIKHEISVQTEVGTLNTKQSVATDPMISSQSMESLLSGVSAPPYHNRRAGLGRSGSSFSTQSLSAFERGRSRSPLPRSSSMHGEAVSFGRGLNSISQDPIHCSWSRPFWGTDPMYYKPHGLRRLGQNDSREDDFDGTWGSVDRLNKDLKKRKEEKWSSDSIAKPRFHRSLTDLKHDKRPESPYMPEMEFLQTVRDAERFGYTVDDLQVAYLHCGKGDPVLWLEDNWNEMIKNVIALAAKYGQDNEENDVGAISTAEAKEALRVHRGDLWDAVTECIEIRQRKILELTVRGNFTQKQIVEALKNNDGNVELAYADLIRATSRVFKHILSPGLSEESEDIGCQRVSSETVAEPSASTDIVSFPKHTERSSTSIIINLTEDENAQKKRSDFLTKLSAIRQAQSERRKAREEKELNREVEKVFKENYLDITNEITSATEMKVELPPTWMTIEDLSEQGPELYSDSLPESHNIPPSSSEMSIPHENICKPVQSEKDTNSTSEKIEELGDQISATSIEKDEDITEDFDSHWIDSQGEWIEEFSDEQWEEEGEEGRGEWVTVRTKYRKLETDLDVEAKQLASLWENVELVDDVFEDDKGTTEANDVFEEDDKGSTQADDAFEEDDKNSTQADDASGEDDKGTTQSVVFVENDKDTSRADGVFRKDDKGTAQTEDIFEEDSKGITQANENIVEISQDFISPKQDNWEELNSSEQEESVIKQSVETGETSKEDYQNQFVISKYSMKDSENNWITTDAEGLSEFPLNLDFEGNVDDEHVFKGDWVAVQSEEVEDKDFFIMGITNEEKLELLEQATAECEVIKENELHDSISEQWSEEEWEKVEAHEHYPDSLPDNLVTTTDDEGQYLGKLSSEEDPDLILTSTFENATQNGDESFANDPFKNEVTNDILEPLSESKLLSKVKDISSEDMTGVSSKYIVLPPKRQKARFSSTENANEVKNNAEIPLPLLDVISQEVQEPKNLASVPQESTPPVPVRRKSKVNGLPFEMKSKMEIFEISSEQKENISISPPVETVDELHVSTKEDILNDNHLQTSIDSEVLREGDEIFQSALNYSTTDTDKQKFGTQLVAGGSRYLALSCSEQVSMAFESKNASPEPSLTYESDSNCFADSESEFDNKDNHKVYHENEESFETGFGNLSEQTYLEQLKDNQVALEPENQTFQESSESNTKFNESFIIRNSEVDYFQSTSEMPLEYSKDQTDDAFFEEELNVTETNQYQIKSTLSEIPEKYVNINQAQEPIHSLNAISQGLSGTELETDPNFYEKFSSSPLEVEIQQFVQSQASDIMETSIPPVSHDELSFCSQKIGNEKVEDSSMPIPMDAEEMPTLSEMEASAAADYYFGRYNEVTVTRKGKKKQVLSKTSKPASIAPNAASVSPKVFVSAMTKFSPSLQTSVSPGDSSVGLDSKFQNQHVSSESIAALQSSIDSETFSVKSISEGMKRSSSEAKAESTQKTRPPVEYLSFAEDYFFGSYNEVVTPKKVKKKMPSVKVKENMSNITSTVAASLQSSMAGDSYPTGLAGTKQEESLLQAPAFSESNATYIFETRSETQEIPTQSNPIIPPHSTDVESKPGDLVNTKVSEEEMLSDKLSPNVESESTKEIKADAVIKDTAVLHVDSKNKSVQFQDSKPPVVPPPRRGNQKKNLVTKQNLDPSASESFTTAQQMTQAQRSAIADKENADVNQSSEVMYAAAEYLFGRYDEVTPSTKISTPKTGFVAKKKTSTLH